jgi:hypothetical protein
MLERLNTRRVFSMHPATSEYVCFISSAYLLIGSRIHSTVFRVPLQDFFYLGARFRMLCLHFSIS